MQTYQFHFLDRNDMVITIRSIIGADDAAAIEEGQRLLSVHTIDICCGNRRVDRVERLLPVVSQIAIAPVLASARAI